MVFRNIDWILTVPYNIKISNSQTWHKKTSKILQRLYKNLDSQIGLYVYIPFKMNFWWKIFLFREGYVQTAYSSLLQAGDYNLPEVFVEKAKWFWHKGDKDQALTCLERGMSVHFPDINKLKSDESDQDKTKLKIYAQVNIKTWSDNTNIIFRGAVMVVL